jgi:hypothetical protein
MTVLPRHVQRLIGERDRVHMRNIITFDRINLLAGRRGHELSGRLECSSDRATNQQALPMVEDLRAPSTMLAQ